MDSPTEDLVASIVIEVALEIHRKLGPGLLESVYQRVLEQALIARGLRVRRQADIPVVYEGLVFDSGFRADLVINEVLILEIKSVDRLLDIHFKTLLTYLRFSGLRLGLILNFNEAYFKRGVKRVVNGLPEVKGTRLDELSDKLERLRELEHNRAK